MAIFKPGDVVKVPFPYADRSTRQSRPVFVVSGSSLEDSHGLLRVVMITSAENRAWSGDIPINDLGSAGLPAPSVIRTTKIATIDAAYATRLGEGSAALFSQVATQIERTLTP